MCCLSPGGRIVKRAVWDMAEQSKGYRVFIPYARTEIQDQDLWEGFISRKASSVKERF